MNLGAQIESVEDPLLLRLLSHQRPVLPGSRNLVEPCHDDQQDCHDDGDPLPHRWSEYDGGVDHHESEHALQRPEINRRAVGKVDAIPPPCGHVREPLCRESIINIQSSAPVEAGDCGRLLGRVAVGRQVTPVVIEPERTSDVKDVEDATPRPKPPRFSPLPAGAITARGPQVQEHASQVAAYRKPHGPASQHLAPR